MWWKHKPRLLTDLSLKAAIGRGELMQVRDGQWYKISAHVPEKYRYLAPNAFELLEAISVSWARALWWHHEQSYNTFLVVSSLTRPTEYQAFLAKQGFPTAGDSSHEKGLAFDISYAWFIQNRPKLAEALSGVLATGKSRGLLNYISEPSMEIFHVAVSPSFESYEQFFGD